jgi:DNA-binding transcriptional ArsR family regulator
MQIETAAAVFEVLASQARLAVFRLLVRYAPDGLVAGDIARMLEIPKTNLSFHLKALVHGKLASRQREGRNTRYQANIALMLETIAYMTQECCAGDPGTARRAKSGLAPQSSSTCCPGNVT